MDEPESASFAHVAAMAEIHRAAFAASQAWGTTAIGVQLALPGVAGWLDRRGGMILARIAADEMEVLTIAVVPPARRQGIGRKLLDTALAWAGSQGARAALLEVAVGNSAALALYQRVGFSPVGRRPRYYPDGGDALILRRPLIPAAATATN
jgi:ribosomal-protein-alanine N-acetyltransferase